MKTFLTIVVTAGVTWVATSLVHGLRAGAERLWLVSSVKVPGRMALTEIQTDLNEGRYMLARAKLETLADAWETWDRGPDSFDGRGIGGVLSAFAKIETNQVVNPEPDESPDSDSAVAPAK